MDNKKKIFTILLIFTLILTMTSCSKKNIDEKKQSTVENVPETNKENLDYIDQSQIEELYNDPLKFKDQIVKLEGKVISSEDMGNTRSLQVLVDVNGEERNTIVADNLTATNYQEGDIIIFDGKIFGECRDENLTGGDKVMPSITLINIEFK